MPGSYIIIYMPSSPYKSLVPVLVIHTKKFGGNGRVIAIVIITIYEACAMLAFKDIMYASIIYRIYTTFFSPDEHAGILNNFVRTQVLSERT